MHEFRDIDGTLFDLDGTLISGGTALPWAHDLIEASKGRFAVVTNDAEHTAEEILSMMQDAGLSVPREMIVAAGVEAVRLVAEEMPGAKITMAASRSLRSYAETLGLHLTDIRPDVVLIGRDRQFSYDTLSSTANAVLSGAKLIICNPDRTHPGPEGTVVPETGALAASILACTGPVQHRVIGKPEPGVFLAGMRLLGTTPKRTLMVGDNPETDGKGAAGLQMNFLKVGC